MKRAVPAHAEARDDHHILSELARRMGLENAFTEGLSSEQWLERLYRENAERVTALGITLPSFEQFWAQGLIDLAPHDVPHVMHAEFRRNPELHPLATPSGKIEIFSQRIAAFALEDCPGYPVWREPFEWLGHPSAAHFPLHAVHRGEGLTRLKIGFDGRSARRSALSLRRRGG